MNEQRMKEIGAKADAIAKMSGEMSENPDIDLTLRAAPVMFLLLNAYQKVSEEIDNFGKIVDDCYKLLKDNIGNKLPDYRDFLDDADGIKGVDNWIAYWDPRKEK